MGIIIHIKLLHLRDITLLDGSFLINQRLEHIVLMFNQLTISQIDHTDTVTLRSTVGITEI